MTVTLDANTPQQIGRVTWRVSWSSSLTDPTFYVYRDGLQVATTRATSIDLVVQPGEQPVIEVLDSASESPLPSRPGNLTLAWYASAGTPVVDYYRVDEYVAAAWTERVRVQETGAGYYTWRSRFLEDVTEHQFRIVAVGENGNEATAASFTCLMVRHPDVPSVTYSYDKVTDKITVTAA